MHSFRSFLLALIGTGYASSERGTVLTPTLIDTENRPSWNLLDTLPGPHIEPHSAAPLHGLRSRAFSLRRLLRGTAWQGPSVAPLVPRLAGEQTERVPLRKVTA